MLSIISIDEEGCTRTVQDYHLGIGHLRDRIHYQSGVEYVVQADGHELQAVLESFPYLRDKLPKRPTETGYQFKRVPRFVGDDAKYIIQNLEM